MTGQLRMRRVAVSNRRNMVGADERARTQLVSALTRGRRPGRKRLLMRAIVDRCDRVRANSIEALGPMCKRVELARILASHLGDHCNRVRANALMGLLRLGYQRADAYLVRMVYDERAAFRASAAYVIGKSAPTGRHLRWLELLLEDTAESVSSQARLSAKALGLVAWRSRDDGALARSDAVRYVG